jgi:cellulose synthase/poly-beta-1,6-N-acetylglucosamine synthase-like glycosyltransferase
MKISLLIPCHNEGKTLERSIESWLSQTRPADEIIVVDDASTDSTPYILDKYKDRLIVVRTPHCTGNKSGAQEYGLVFVTGEVFATTDADTLLDSRFLERIDEDFQDPSVAAVGGYVKSLKHNWITACRALDYSIGQNIDKLAQSYVGFMLVIPGAAGAFRTSIFREKIGFDHDTLTEDLDFTYKLHKLGHKILYDRAAICYTQDPPNFSSYVNQMRRWFGGGWQNFIKHFGIPKKPGMALQLSMIYVEGLLFSILALALPFINILMTVVSLGLAFVIVFVLAIMAAWEEDRPDFLLVVPAYLFLRYVHAYLYLEQFFKEVLLRRKNLVWFQPERVQL